LKPHLHLRRPAWAAPLCSKRILSAVLLPDDRVDVTEKRPRLLTLVRRDQREKENERLGVQSMLARVHELDFQVVLPLGKFHGDAAASMVRRSGGGIRWVGVVKDLLAIQRHPDRAARADHEAALAGGGDRDSRPQAVDPFFEGRKSLGHVDPARRDDERLSLARRRLDLPPDLSHEAKLLAIGGPEKAVVVALDPHADAVHGESKILWTRSLWVARTSGARGRGRLKSDGSPLLFAWWQGISDLLVAFPTSRQLKADLSVPKVSGVVAKLQRQTDGLAGVRCRAVIAVVDR